MKTETWVYSDPQEGFNGFLSICGEGRSLAAGGLRVQSGLSGETITTLAQIMNAKQRALGINADGAKCGIDYDPEAPGKKAAVGRFLTFLKPFLEQRLSVGPDMGTGFAEIEALANAEGIPSVKGAAGRAQGMNNRELLARMRILEQPIGALTLGERRAGHGLAHTALATWRSASARDPVTAAVQGFGTLGRAAALSLEEMGLRVVAIADERRCIEAHSGIRVRPLLTSRPGVLEGEGANESSVDDPSKIFDIPADVLVLAACEDALSPVDAKRVAAQLIAIGANDGVSRRVEEDLHTRGHLVVPDVVAGSGGSAAMDALLAPTRRPDAESVLKLTALTAARLAEAVMAESEDRAISPREAAVRVSERHLLGDDARPYGLRMLCDFAESSPNAEASGVRNYTHAS